MRERVGRRVRAVRESHNQMAGGGEQIPRYVRPRGVLLPIGNRLTEGDEVLCHTIRTLKLNPYNGLVSKKGPSQPWQVSLKVHSLRRVWREEGIGRYSLVLVKDKKKGK